MLAAQVEKTRLASRENALPSRMKCGDLIVLTMNSLD